MYSLVIFNSIFLEFFEVHLCIELQKQVVQVPWWGSVGEQQNV